ncbi:MAG: cupin domain-containing protein [Acidobacteria bacterium]|nr:cupin domain-containing protein [Acidobacteriota bacterium]
MGYAEGTKRKFLRRGLEGQATTFLLKLPPGFAMGSHSHVTVEHHYVLEGEYEAGGQCFPVGTYRLIPKEAQHGPFYSTTGAVVLVICE